MVNLQPKAGIMLKCCKLFLIILISVSFIVKKTYAAMPDSSRALLSMYEDTLRSLQYEKVKPNTSDDYRQVASDKFGNILKRALQLPGSFNYPFDSLTTLSRLISPDKKFRILNWNISRQDGTSKYYGFIQSLNPKKKTYTLYELHDIGNTITNPELATGTADKWLGMLYYKIIPCQNEANTYFLLGWQGYSDIIARKIIDVISFNAEGAPIFGKAIFKHPPVGFKNIDKRIMFQYGASVYMSLKYDDAKKMILYDRLAPPNPGLTGQYQYYGPSFQIDALAYKDRDWICIENVDARNNASPNDKNYHPEGEDFHKKKKPIYAPSH